LGTDHLGPDTQQRRNLGRNSDIDLLIGFWTNENEAFHTSLPVRYELNKNVGYRQKFPFSRQTSLC